MRSANNVGPHVRLTFLNDVFTFLTEVEILNRNGFGEGNDTNQERRVFLFYLFFGGFSLERSSYASQYIQIYLFS
jgi:hypothetical protein